MNISNPKELATRFRSFPHAALVAFEGRKAARYLPYLFETVMGDEQVVIPEHEGMLLFCFRSILVSCAMCTARTEGLRRRIRLAAKSAERSEQYNIPRPLLELPTATTVAVNALKVATTETREIAGLAESISQSLVGEDAFETAEGDDYFLLISSSDGAALWQQPLWPDRGFPARFSNSWALFHDTALDTEWEFWVRWYDQLIRGFPHDGYVMQSLATMSGDIWKKGAKAVAQVIARTVEESHNLEPPTSANSISDQTEHTADFSNSTSSFRGQVDTILAAPKRTAESIGTFVAQLDYATSITRANCGNDVPQDLIIVEAFTSVLRDLAKHLNSSAPDRSFIEADLQRALSEIQRLNEEIQRLNAAASKGKTQWFKSGFVGGLGATLGAGTGSAILFSAELVLGEYGSGFLYQLKDSLDQLWGTNETPPSYHGPSG